MILQGKKIKPIHLNNMDAKIVNKMVENQIQLVKWDISLGCKDVSAYINL
jgi:hypothetical protein